MARQNTTKPTVARKQRTAVAAAWRGPEWARPAPAAPVAAPAPGRPKAPGVVTPATRAITAAQDWLSKIGFIGTEKGAKKSPTPRYNK